MTPQRDPEELLNDLLSDTASADFRAALLAETIHRAHRRRRWQHVRRIGGGIAVVAIAAILLWPSRPSRPTESAPRMHSYEMVKTNPTFSAPIVATRPGSCERAIAIGERITVVRTSLDPAHLHRLTDRELLALAGPDPAALIRIAPHESRLIRFSANNASGP